jgi:5-methylcytosine-specific restriction endonuclease McrA
VLANVRRREARKKAADGHHTGTEIKALFKRQGGKCAYCRVMLKPGYHADHIIPISKGGSNWISNIQLTCSDCNHRKWAKDPITWARQIGRLL